MSKFLKFKSAAVLGLILLGVAGQASAQTQTQRYSVPGFSYESSPRQQNFEFRVPGASHRIENTYPRGRAAFDRTYEDTMRRLRQGGGVQNGPGALRYGQSVTTYGGTVRGFGYEHQRTSPTTARSAQEDALHMWQRTEHLRRMWQRTEHLRRMNPAERLSSGGGVR
jgi:hypothetical protein